MPTCTTTINFSVANPTSNFGFTGASGGIAFDSQYNAWLSNANDWSLNFSLNIPAVPSSANLTLSICSGDVPSPDNCYIDISINGNMFVTAYGVTGDQFQDVTWAIPTDKLNAGANALQIMYSSGDTVFFINSAAVSIPC